MFDNKREPMENKFFFAYTRIANSDHFFKADRKTYRPSEKALFIYQSPTKKTMRHVCLGKNRFLKGCVCLFTHDLASPH